MRDAYKPVLVGVFVAGPWITTIRWVRHCSYCHTIFHAYNRAKATCGPFAVNDWFVWNTLSISIRQHKIMLHFITLEITWHCCPAHFVFGNSQEGGRCQ